MIASLITALYLAGIIAPPSAVTFLYLIGVGLIIAEFTVLATFGITAFNGILAIIAGYMIDNGADGFAGLELGWPLLFGIAAAEILMLIGGIALFLNQRKLPVTTGVEAMIGQTATVLDWKNTNGRVRVLGEEWAARSDEKLPLKIGDNVIVTRVEKVTVVVAHT